MKAKWLQQEMQGLGLKSCCLVFSLLSPTLLSLLSLLSSPLPLNILTSLSISLRFLPFLFFFCRPDFSSFSLTHSNPTPLLLFRFFALTITFLSLLSPPPKLPGSILPETFKLRNWRWRSLPLLVTGSNWQPPPTATPQPQVHKQSQQHQHQQPHRSRMPSCTRSPLPRLPLRPLRQPVVQAAAAATRPPCRHANASLRCSPRQNATCEGPHSRPG